MLVLLPHFANRTIGATWHGAIVNSSASFVVASKGICILDAVDQPKMSRRYEFQSRRAGTREGCPNPPRFLFVMKGWDLDTWGRAKLFTPPN